MVITKEEDEEDYQELSKTVFGVSDHSFEEDERETPLKSDLYNLNKKNVLYKSESFDLPTPLPYPNEIPLLLFAVQSNFSCDTHWN